MSGTSGSTDRGAGSRQAALAKKRQSRRPSRLGAPAGAAPKPDYLVDADAGFPGLLKRTWERALAAPSPAEAADILLTLDGHVPADIQLRALGAADEAALKVLFGLTWRAQGGRVPAAAAPGPGDEPAFLGGLGLTAGGRVVVHVPSPEPPAAGAELVGERLYVPWSAQALAQYRAEVSRLAEQQARSVVDCRRWLDAAGARGRDAMVELLKDAALRTAPFVLYQADEQYTNFRDRNTITGKTLWPGHPDCALSRLSGLPLGQWSDSEAVIVVCLTLLVRSGSYARIEEANGTQLTVDHVAHLLERIRRNYAAVAGGSQVPPAASHGVDALEALATALGERRRHVITEVQLYRLIHGALMHKIECVAAPPGSSTRQLDEALAGRLSDLLPVAGGTLRELGDAVAADPDWLTEPHGGFGTGLESLVRETVAASLDVFDLDFAMSRGLRSLPDLIKALREGDSSTIVEWDLPYFFCCVLASPRARRHFDGSAAHLADMAWAMSSRMQYNSWHFIAGNLDKGPALENRDYFVPPSIPDIALYSDQHHHGHVAAKVRFSVRSPQAVEVLGRRFNGFIDLRLLRCDGPPLAESDLLAAHRASSLIARATSAAAALAAEGREFEVTSFDAAWHWARIAAGEGR